MPFPIALDDVLYAGPAALARDLADAAGNAGGARPSERVAELLESAHLSREEATGLAAAFLQRPDPAIACEGARIAVALGDARFGPMLLDLLDAGDAGVLLASDPTDPTLSTEDVLLGAAARLVDARDDALRGRLLERLRYAGLPSLEVPLLCEHGSVDELARWFPAIFSEGLRVEDLPHVVARIARRDAGAEAVRAALDLLEPDARAVVLSALGENRRPLEA